MTVGTKRCPTCRESFPRTNKYFSAVTTRGKKYLCRCRGCANKASAEYVKRNKDKVQKKRFIDRCLVKLQVWHHYCHGSVRCVCCGESDLRFLSIDHIDGGGTQHFIKRWKGGETSDIYKWLVKNNYPEGYQVLCFNCNQAKHICGKCPHEIGDFCGEVASLP